MIDVESKFIVSSLQCVLHRESFLVSSFANHVTIKLARFVALIFLSAVLFSSVKLYYSRYFTIVYDFSCQVPPYQFVYFSFSHLSLAVR